MKKYFLGTFAVASIIFGATSVQANVDAESWGCSAMHMPGSLTPLMGAPHYSFGCHTYVLCGMKQVQCTVSMTHPYPPFQLEEFTFYEGGQDFYIVKSDDGKHHVRVTFQDHDGKVVKIQSAEGEAFEICRPHTIPTFKRESDSLK